MERPTKVSAADPPDRGGEANRHEVTQLLQAWNGGEAEALDRLTPLVYDELRRIAGRFMRRESRAQTLQTTALVHEAYLRLVDASAVDWQDRTHFYAIAARVMRRVLVDLARSRRRAKRGSGAVHLELDEVMLATPAQDLSLLELDLAMERLAAFDERKSRVVELRFFAGLSVEETARALAVSRDTVMRDWRVAKLWLLRELSEAEGDGR